MGTRCGRTAPPRNGCCAATPTTSRRAPRAAPGWSSTCCTASCSGTCRSCSPASSWDGCWAGSRTSPGCRWSTRRRRSCWCRCTGWGSSCSPPSRWWPAHGGATGARACAATARARWRSGRRCASASPGSRWWCWPCRGSPRSTARAPARCSAGSPTSRCPRSRPRAVGCCSRWRSPGSRCRWPAVRGRGGWVFALAVLASGALLGVPLLASLEYATRVGISGWDVVAVAVAAAIVRSWRSRCTTAATRCTCFTASASTARSP